MRSFVLASFIGMPEAYPLPAGMLGTWTPTTIPHAVLGPNRFIAKFTVAKDPRKGDFWFSAIDGQDFRVSANTNEMQYCFSASVVPVSEQAPFYIDSMTDTKVDFCWRGKPMPTHAAGCQACECAKITLELKSEDTMHFTFMMSPPVKHVHIEVKRTGKPPKMAFYKRWLGGKRCEFQNKTGFLPYIGDDDPEEDVKLHEVKPMQSCPTFSNFVTAKVKSDLEASVGKHKACRQLDGLNHMLDKTNVPDVKLQYIKPRIICWPCDVQYSVSAEIAQDQYIGVGFKGMGYAIKLHEKPIRPNYFGMSHDPIDEKRTGTAMALGHGDCFREMKSPNYVGSVVDVAEGDRKLKKTSVERKNGRTIVRFTVSQHIGRDTAAIDDFFGDPVQMSARVMWAIGNVNGDVDQCNATLAYHQHFRGVAPLNWLSVGSSSCKYHPSEMDSSADENDSSADENDSSADEIDSFADLMV